MAINPEHFEKINVTDTCAVWNIISSRRLFAISRQAGCQYVLTTAVHYECLIKPRKSPSSAELELQNRMKKEIASFEIHAIDIEDLQDPEFQKQRNSFGMGELSCIAFAKKTRLSFLTDDQGARKLGSAVLPNGGVQTTPHLLSWLRFHDKISDTDTSDIIKEHKALERKLEPHFNQAVLAALQAKYYQHKNRYETQGS